MGLGLLRTGDTVELALASGQVYRVETITNLSSQSSLTKPFHYQMSFDRDIFEVVDSDTEVSQGVLRHDFAIRCRKPAAHAQVKLSPRDLAEAIHVPDLVLPLRVLSTAATKFWEMAPLVFVGLGIVLAMLGTLASPTGTAISPTVNYLVQRLYGRPGAWILRIVLLNFGDEVKSLLKFGAIILSSTGGWLAYVAERRYKLPFAR